MSFDFSTVGMAVFAALMLVCLLSSKISSRLNMPCLLLFLAVGMLAGSEGIGKLTFDNAAVANAIGTMAMAFILFSGGFDTEWKNIRPVFLTGGILSSFGVLLTALFTGIFAYYFLNLLWPDTSQPIQFSWCLLLGSIISSTDAAAVFSILRSKSVSLQGNLQPLLEFESGSNDPMAAFLTIFMVNVVMTEVKTKQVLSLLNYWEILPEFLVKMAIGLVMGYLIGRLVVWLYNRIGFDYNGLYYALSIVVVLLAYSCTELAYGNGFMAVYVAGMVMGNRKFVFHNGVGRFYDGLAWIMQVVLFSMLGLLAFPSKVWAAKWIGLAVACFLMLAARPLATFIGMWRSKFTMKERVFVSWVGLRGGAPIMLATFPMMGGVPQAELLFHIVFFIVLTSVLLQGMTIMPLAKLLKLDAPLRKTPLSPLALEETGDKNSDSREITVTQKCSGMTLADLSLPDGALVLLIRRDDKFIVPRGDTELEADDVLTVMGTPAAIQESMVKLT